MLGTGKGSLYCIRMHHGEKLKICSQNFLSLNLTLRLPLVEYILKNYRKRNTVTVRELDITTNGNYRPQLRRVKQSSEKNIVVCSSIEQLPEILKQAQQVGLMTDEHKFIISSLDFHTIDLEPFQHSGTNITGFRLVSPEDPFVVATTDFFKKMYLKDNPAMENENNGNVDGDADEERDYSNSHMNDVEIPEGLTADKLQVNTALTYDAVLLFSNVMWQHDGIRSKGLVCDDRESTFVNGTSVFNSMKTIGPLKGLSGFLQFDQHGNRENFQLEVLELATEGLKKIGTWNATKGIQSIQTMSVQSGSTGRYDIRNKTFTVLTVIVSRSFIFLTFLFTSETIFPESSVRNA